VKAVRQRELARTQERKELDAAGRNPDAIFAVRDEAQRMKHRAARLKANTLKQEMQLLDQLILEDTRAKKVAEVERVHEEHLEAYRKINGPSIISKFVRGKDVKVTSKPHHDVNDVESKLDEVECGEASAALNNFSGAPLDVDQENVGAGAVDRESEGSDSDSDVDRIPPEAKGSIYVSPRHIPNAWNEHRRKLQQKKVAGALVRQHERLQQGEPRTVCGKTYGTSKFLSEPQRIVFKDFVVGSTYQQKVVLTNASFAFNSFKVSALPDEYTDYFKVLFRPPGRMSAGTTNSLTVIFKPKVNQDIVTELPLLAETGPFTIPLLCVTCKSVISVGPTLLELGAVVLGDSATHQVTITNEGSRAVPFVCRLLVDTPDSDSVDRTVLLESGETSQVLHDAADLGHAAYVSESEAPQVFFETTGYIGGYTQVKFPVKFTPTTDGVYSCRLQFDFGTEADRQQPVNWGSEHSFVIDASGTYPNT
jgi:hypothetical protein